MLVTATRARRELTVCHPVLDLENLSTIHILPREMTHEIVDNVIDISLLLEQFVKSPDTPNRRNDLVMPLYVASAEGTSLGFAINYDVDLL